MSCLHKRQVLRLVGTGCLLILPLLFSSCESQPQSRHVRVVPAVRVPLTVRTWQVVGSEVPGSGGITQATTAASGSVTTVTVALDPGTRPRGFAFAPVGQPVQPDDSVLAAVQVPNGMDGVRLQLGLYHSAPSAPSRTPEAADFSGWYTVGQQGVVDLGLTVRNAGASPAPWVTLEALPGASAVTGVLEVVELAVLSPALARAWGRAWGGWRTRAMVMLASAALGYTIGRFYGSRVLRVLTAMPSRLTSWWRGARTLGLCRAFLFVVHKSLDRRLGQKARAVFEQPLQPLLRAGAGCLLIGSLGLCGTATVVVYYNMIYSRDQITRMLRHQEPKGSLALPNADPVPAWVMPYMVDLSVVTPGLIVFTAACMAYGAALLLRSSVPVAKLTGRRFPFPSAYRTHYVQMGLLGTLIGFVIAFANPDLAAERQADVLLAALGTALWSSLMAIALAYLVCPVVEGLYQQLGRLRTGVLITADTSSAVNELRGHTMAAAAALNSLTGSVKALDLEMGIQQLGVRLTALEAKLHTVSDDVSRIKSEVGDVSRTIRSLESRLAVVEAWGQKMAGLISAVAALQRVDHEASSRIEALEKSSAELIRKLNRPLLE